MKILLSLCLILLQIGIVSAQKLHFAHVTDTHIGSQSATEDLNATIDDINRQAEIDFVLFTGDITEFGSDEELIQARKIIDRLKIPWYITPGNHDSKWSESGNNSFVTIFGSERFSFEKNGYLFIGTASGPNMRMGPGLVPREQIVFLDSVLKSRKNPDQPVIFVNHYPLDESLSNWYDVTDRLNSVNIKATLLGHGHANRIYNFEGIPGIMGRSNLQTKKAEVGYNLVTIKQDTIFYAERLSSGKILPIWCKVPAGANPRGNSSSKNINDAVASKPFPRPDYSVNQKYPNIRALWKIQEMSDIGSGISAHKNRAVYANTAGDIVAIDLRSGSKIWSFITAGKIYSTPAIDGNRVVCASTDHNIYCLDLQSGKLIWMHPTVKPIVASPAVEATRVYIGSSDGSFRCINLSDGKLIWKFDSVKNFVECKPLILKNSVSFGSWGNTFYSLDKKTGNLNWKREIQGNRMLSPAAVWPVAAHGKIFVVAPDRHLTALDENTGKEIWDSGKYSCRESIGISANGNLVFIKNMTEGNVDAFFTAATNQELAWECKADLGYEIAPSPLIESGKFLYVPTATGVVVAINTKTHQVAWKHKICNALINSVLPIGKGRILVSTMDGQVVCLAVE
ncbi:MAG: PQQ-binding-like beta-propeller repeat protein [Prolixibacteraceae bacterium]|nr:PQQ-binding-like beta-propeller repeat protein [Prolixibacteraceae bacterium]